MNNFTKDKEQKRLFFIALLPPTDVEKVAQELTEEFATIYNSKHGLKSPPHVTLQPPFKWDLNQVEVLKESLENFSQNQFSIPMILDGFGSFKPRVIYINVVKTPELLSIQNQLKLYLESNLGIIDEKQKHPSFNPHLTLAHKDLTKSNYYKAWKIYKDKSINFKFRVYQLTLLLHDEKRWKIYHNFSFQQ